MSATQENGPTLWSNLKQTMVPVLESLCQGLAPKAGFCEALSIWKCAVERETLSHPEQEGP